METLDSLSQQGWYITPEGLKTVTDDGAVKGVKAIVRNLLDVDLRDIATSTLASEVTKNKINQIVVQVQKVRNISAPKINEESNVAPRMLKLTVTDGSFSCQAVETEHIPSLSLERTVPGTKLLLKGCDVISGCVLLKQNSCVVLGGKVTAILEKWEITKSLVKHNRGSGRAGVDGPPAWVNFGTKIECSVGAVAAAGQPFKSLQTKEKEKKEHEEFEVQRQDAIAEATTGAIKKVFGGGIKLPASHIESSQRYNNSMNARPVKNVRNNKREAKEKVEIEKSQKPADKISLFAFLEDKLPVNERPDAEQPLNYNARQNYSVNGYDNHRGATYRGNGTRDNYSQRKSYNTDFGTYNSNPRKEFTPRQQSNFNRAPDKMNYSEDNFVRSERAPRFQKHEPQSYFSDSPKFNFNRHKTQDNNLDGVVQNFDKISLNDGNNFARNTLKQQLNYKDVKSKSGSNKFRDNSEPEGYLWCVGDQCMAKYWEDNKYYNAYVTGTTIRTCVVQFLDYGNYEEVLKLDCIPITEEYPAEEDEEKPYKRSPAYSRNQYSGNVEFRQNKGRPFPKHSFQQ